MPVKTIQLGQVWREDTTGKDFLVTKLYNEVFTQYAVLRQASSGASTGDTVRVRVKKLDNGMTLPGYTYTQELQDV